MYDHDSALASARSSSMNLRESTQKKTRASKTLAMRKPRPRGRATTVKMGADQVPVTTRMSFKRVKAPRMPVADSRNARLVLIEEQDGPKVSYCSSSFNLTYKTDVLAFSSLS